MSKESAAGHDTEGEIALLFHDAVLLWELICLHLVLQACLLLSFPSCNKAGAEDPVQSKQRVAEAADYTA